MKLINIRWPLIWVLLLWLGFNPQAMATQPGEPAPALVLPLLGNDKEIRLSDFEGKIVYVDFWAAWCGPCRQSLPLYEELYSRLPKDRFQILAVNLDEKLKDADNFLKRHPVSYPVLLDPSGDSARAWSVPVMPSSYLVNPDGTLARIYVGFEPSHIRDIEHDIKTLLDSMPGARVDGSDGLR